MGLGGEKMEIGCKKKKPHRPSPCGFIFNLRSTTFKNARPVLQLLTPDSWLFNKNS